MEFAWDGTLDMMLVIIAVAVGAVHLRSRLELAVTMPAAPSSLPGLTDISGARPTQRGSFVPLAFHIRLPRKLPPSDDGNNEEPASSRFQEILTRNQDLYKEADQPYAKLISTDHFLPVRYSDRHPFRYRRLGSRHYFVNAVREGGPLPV